jgi:hypothetical protein
VSIKKELAAYESAMARGRELYVTMREARRELNHLEREPASESRDEEALASELLAAAERHTDALREWIEWYGRLPLTTRVFKDV